MFNPGSPYIGELGLAGASDNTIWDCARQQRFAIATKEEDLQRLSVLYGQPPK
jgi:predicted nuclease of predicted toxin-antitoxin system